LALIPASFPLIASGMAGWMFLKFFRFREHRSLAHGLANRFLLPLRAAESTASEGIGPRGQQ
jgi:hypothetical protein